MFWRKKPHRLYIPTQARWYTRPRSSFKTPQRRSWRRGTTPFFISFLKNRFALVILGAGFLTFAVILGSSSYFAIRAIEVLREDFNINSAVIENELNPYIGNPILFFPRRQVIRTIQEKFPEFRSIEVQKILPHTLKVSLVSHDRVANLKAYYRLPEAKEDSLDPQNPLEDSAISRSAFSLNPETRGVEPKTKPVEQKSLLNDRGQAIFDQEENLELITIIIRGLTQPIKDREQVIPPEHMAIIREAIQYFYNTMNIEIESLEYLPLAREIHLKAKSGPTIWLTTEKNDQEQIDKLKTIYEPAELNQEEISYIDLRIREKVIYCPKLAPCAR